MSGCCVLLQFWPADHAYPCHETTARAARLEWGGSVTLIWLVSNALVYQGCRLGTPEDSATLLQKKGQKGFVRGEAL